VPSSVHRGCSLGRSTGTFGTAEGGG
jgi:hypothetical protein